jgi:putative GTP pyrophosphokinase
MSKRSKSLPSLAKKFQSRTQNETRSSLDIIKDIGGIRLVFSDLCELQRCQQSLERHYAIWQKKDFISQPKADGYRSLHYIVIQDDVPIEVQLRTEAMDRWATWTHDLIYKNAELLQGLIGEEALDELRLYAAELAAYQNALEHGIARHPPKRPESLPILWEYASAANREIMREQGDLAPCIIRPCCARDAHTYIGHVAQQGTQHRG